MLYWLLTRELPFGDRQRPGPGARHPRGDAPAPHALNPRVPPALSELCLRMLEKAPEARYADAVALAGPGGGCGPGGRHLGRAAVSRGQAKRAKAPCPVPRSASGAPARGTLRWPWAAGSQAPGAAGGGARAPGHLLSCVTPFVQRTESPTPTPPQQAVPARKWRQPR